MKVSIIYASLSGNTEEIAEAISDRIVNLGGACDVFHVSEAPLSFEEYDIVLFGTFTWTEGSIPEEMREELRYILKENQMKINRAAVFGSGDEIFPHYCRAVDEIIYHLGKYGVEVYSEGLKIEQSCRGSQMKKVENWVDNIFYWRNTN